MKDRMQWLMMLILFWSLILSACCSLSGPEEADEESTVFNEPIVIRETEEFRQTATHTFEPERDEPTATATFEPGPTEWYTNEILAVRLTDYIDEPNLLTFVIEVANPTFEPLIESKVRLVLYDDSGVPLIEHEFFCDRIEAFSECLLNKAFYKSLLPEAYTAYNIYVEATTPGGETLTAQLSDFPVSGQEGVAISEGRSLPFATVMIFYKKAPDSYRLGMDLTAGSFTTLRYGRFYGGALACLQITELRQYTDGRQETVTLAEHCDQVFLGEERGESRYISHDMELSFQPSGYTWVPQESIDRTYVPLSIHATASLMYHDVVVASDSEDFRPVPALEVKAAWWGCRGNPTEVYQPGETCHANIVLHSLADDPLTRSVQLDVRYTEFDPNELDMLFLLIPCLFGLCEDEVVVHTQTYDLRLVADKVTEYSLQVELPLHPTGEIDTHGYFFLAVNLEGVTIWRGAELSPVSGP